MRKHGLRWVACSRREARLHFTYGSVSKGSGLSLFRAFEVFCVSLSVSPHHQDTNRKKPSHVSWRISFSSPSLRAVRARQAFSNLLMTLVGPRGLLLFLPGAWVIPEHVRTAQSWPARAFESSPETLLLVCRFSTWTRF